MSARPDSKFSLKDLHQEIDFFDRKIAHCRRFEKFDSEEARELASHKLAAKRETLVKQALAMAARGITCDPKYLPRSFKEAAEPAKADS